MRENIFFIIKHPTDALRAVGYKLERRILDDFARTNYEGMSITATIRAIQVNRPPRVILPNTTIQISDWPPEAQKKIKAGNSNLKGHHPEHPNI